MSQHPQAADSKSNTHSPFNLNILKLSMSPYPNAHNDIKTCYRTFVGDNEESNPDGFLFIMGAFKYIYIYYSIGLKS